MTENNFAGKSRVIKGVCVRLGDNFKIDPAVLRIFFMVLTMFWGIGIWLYLLLVVFLPAQINEKNESNS